LTVDLRAASIVDLALSFWSDQERFQDLGQDPDNRSAYRITAAVQGSSTGPKTLPIASPTADDGSLVGVGGMLSSESASGSVFWVFDIWEYSTGPAEVY
jgi:hypothetical protein